MFVGHVTSDLSSCSATPQPQPLMETTTASAQAFLSFNLVCNLCVLIIPILCVSSILGEILGRNN